jgi:hypothetical protein
MTTSSFYLFATLLDCIYLIWAKTGGTQKSTRIPSAAFNTRSANFLRTCDVSIKDFYIAMEKIVREVKKVKVVKDKMPLFWPFLPEKIKGFQYLCL